MRHKMAAARPPPGVNGAAAAAAAAAAASSSCSSLAARAFNKSKDVIGVTIEIDESKEDLATSSASPITASPAPTAGSGRTKSTAEVKSSSSHQSSPKDVSGGNGSVIPLVTTVRQQQQDVVLRRHRRGSSGEVGRLLKEALSDYFGGTTGGNRVCLDEYISEVFHQLDYDNCGSIARADFDTLCEVLHISHSPPPSYRNSGLEWLSSYRPHSPHSPLRIDKLGEVKFSRGQKKAPLEQPPNFLFTLGERPFWELWPQKKRRRRRLNIDEFKKSLLEQWAKNEGFPPNVASTVLPVKNELIESVPDGNGHNGHNGGGGGGFSTAANGLAAGGRFQAAFGESETRAKRLMRRIRRLTRRYRLFERLSRRRRRRPPPPPPPSPPPPLRDPTFGRLEENCAETWRDSPASSIFLDQPKRKFGHLERRVHNQQREIYSLKEVVEDLRSSLQLSDAQNLALQVSITRFMVRQRCHFRRRDQTSSRTARNTS